MLKQPVSDDLREALEAFASEDSHEGRYCRWLLARIQDGEITYTEADLEVLTRFWPEETAHRTGWGSDGPGAFAPEDTREHLILVSTGPTVPIERRECPWQNLARAAYEDAQTAYREQAGLWWFWRRPGCWVLWLRDGEPWRWTGLSRQEAHRLALEYAHVAASPSGGPG